MPPSLPAGIICPLCGGKDHRPGRKAPVGLETVTCLSCGLEHVNPRPTLDDLKKIYAESYYDAWNLKGEQDAVRRLKGRTSEGHLRILEQRTQKGRILDVGCATGFFLIEARKRGWDPWGVELSEFAAKEAAREVGADRIFNGMVEQCPFEAGSFSAVTLMDCIEHVLDINGVMAAVARFLRPGGSVLITTPYVGSLTYRLMGGRWTHYKLEHIQYFGKQSTRELFERAGLRQTSLAGARKHISIDYFAHQFARYQHPVITPLAKAIHAITPRALGTATIPLLLGDLVATAEKPGGSAAAGG